MASRTLVKRKPFARQLRRLRKICLGLPETMEKRSHGGWIGVELDQINDEALDAHIRQAWQLITRKSKK